MLLAVAANLIWGLTPLYFYFFKNHDAYNVIFMQIISTLFVLLLVRSHLFSLKSLPSHFITAGLLLANWLSYFLAIQSGRTTEASLGYLLLPFLTILCGVFFLRESLTNRTMISLFISSVGLIFLILSNQQIPFFGIIIASSFALYITVHKIMDNHDPVTSLLHELIIIMPGFMVFSYFYTDRPVINFSENISLLPLGVIVTAPLVIYMTAIKKLTLLNAGMVQLISPLIIVVVSIFFFKEPITTMNLISYAIIVFGFICIILSQKKQN